ncbi:MAG: Rieske 2Fe-2S domain-containing protein [Pseudomonadales bacterium]|nr:Rieske 2Fe-2S domain-containing protein [Pseudomonadales bacterium]
MNHELEVSILKELMEQLDEGKNIDAGVQYKMPTTGYVCPQIAAKERELFFQNHTQLLGLSQDLPSPGSYITNDDFGTPILATRDKNGDFRAFLNACRHRGVRVAQENRGRKTLFTCPFHHWGYSNAGDLINVPDQEHFGVIDKSCNGLIELPAVERDGILWVHPQPDGELDVDGLLGKTLADELAAYDLGSLIYAGTKTITKDLNWKLANDTFGETYHFGKLHKDTLGQLNYGNNLHLKEFGPHHRFVTASKAIDRLKTQPESEWDIGVGAGFVLYYLFPNIQLIVNPGTCTLVKIYPDPERPGRSTSQIVVYFSQAAMDAQADQDAGKVTPDMIYGANEDRGPSLAATMEIFNSTIEQEDYLMGEYQQKSAENGLLTEIMFGRNEPALHHFHTTFRDRLGQPPLEKISA